jgi:hypothetical protein
MHLSVSFRASKIDHAFTEIFPKLEKMTRRRPGFFCVAHDGRASWNSIEAARDATFPVKLLAPTRRVSSYAVFNQ